MIHKMFGQVDASIATSIATRPRFCESVGRRSGDFPGKFLCTREHLNSVVFLILHVEKGNAVGARGSKRAASNVHANQDDTSLVVYRLTVIQVLI